MEDFEIKKVIFRLKRSRLFKDSFWAVFGNGVSFGVMMLAGIVIARFLGKDLYGEYGMVKTTMFQIAGFATFGLGYTSTRFVAKAKSEEVAAISGIVHSSLFITLVSSTILAVFLFIFADSLSVLIEEPSLAMAFRLLGIITIFKAILTTQNGILAGLGEFKKLAYNNIIAGVSLLLVCIPLTLLYSVKGSLLALAISQFLNLLLNFIPLRNSPLINWTHFIFSHIKELLSFSIPVALQELTFSMGSWLTSLILVKMSSMGELGIYSVVGQWASIILFVPNLLSNVVLAHLSGNVSDKNHHQKTLLVAVCVNLCCTILPVIVVYFSADFIAVFYGSTFGAVASVLRISVFTAVLSCVGNVFNNEMIAHGRSWLTFFIRSSRDFIGIIFVYCMLYMESGEDGAKQVVLAHLISGAYYVAVMIMAYCYFQSKREKLAV